MTHGKPDPAAFRVAAARFGVLPGRCVAVEDAPAGVESGHRAGMRSLGVGRLQASLGADLVAEMLEDLP